ESLQERDEVIALGQEAMIYKFKRQKIQTQAQECNMSKIIEL
ncbi:9869_t:CDS:1, partial [Cetraspora pellucida]